jgi:hypothetical protein
LYDEQKASENQNHPPYPLEPSKADIVMIFISYSIVIKQLLLMYREIQNVEGRCGG